MNTIGAIHPDLTDADGPSRMSETLERLNFLVERKSIGLLRGQCHSDVRALTSRLTSQLAHRGFQVAEVHLAGVRSGELPYLFATELGLAVSHHSDEMQSWSLLQGYSNPQDALSRELFSFSLVWNCSTNRSRRHLIGC